MRNPQPKTANITCGGCGAHFGVLQSECRVANLNDLRPYAHARFWAQCPECEDDVKVIRYEFTNEADG